MATVQDAIDRLKVLQKSQTIQLVELGESIRPQKSQDADKRNSAVSDMSAEEAENATPAALQAELQHYKELFSKLRFSYVDQVTKEKFLTAITVDPPLLVEPQENIELEAQLAQVKASLKAQKVEVAEMIAELERRGRELSKRYESVELRTSQLSTLPSEIAGLEATIAELRETQAPHPTNPSLSLPLPATQALIASKEAEITALDNQIASLQAALPRKTRELERLEAELKPLELQRNGTVSAAEEAKRRRDAGEAGMGDDLEERGRWLRAVSQGLKTMLEVEG
ncbi:hypothetical protein K490DRAFT_62817 [Saccharata proteae CBS 121410]|uniref:Kinetochore protein Sos7 coiled-coil domain-containing protein n=1 Tax=Saccharata proteae CBS 121410 TaxID=1314787 RepID=A0A9P4HXY8_9PEZI|nr:hypothetical protein K490DRAFT_62817 [Saccharata proteae CBS 121410]